MLVLNSVQLVFKLLQVRPHRQFPQAHRPESLQLQGGKAGFDVSVIHPSLTFSGRPSAQEAGKAASIREQCKYGKYKDIADKAGMSFYPLVHEAYGRVGEQAHRLFIMTCVAMIAQLRCQPEASVIHYWRARISLALQVSQARGIHEQFRDAQLVYNVGLLDDESTLLNYRGIAWAQ